MENPKFTQDIPNIIGKINNIVKRADAIAWDLATRTIIVKDYFVFKDVLYKLNLGMKIDQIDEIILKNPDIHNNDAIKIVLRK